VTLAYDADGNRVAKTVNGVTTRYLVDDLKPTGYAQVVEEVTAGAVTRQYTYGLQRISQTQQIANTWTPAFYGYDAGGTVRILTDSTGTVTDTYDYDAWGNVLNTTGATPNSYLYRSEQWDSDLELYYFRARYFNATTGRFLTTDPVRWRHHLAIHPSQIQLREWGSSQPSGPEWPRSHNGRIEAQEPEAVWAAEEESTIATRSLEEPVGGAWRKRLITTTAKMFLAACVFNIAESWLNLGAEVDQNPGAVGPLIDLPCGVTAPFTSAPPQAEPASEPQSGPGSDPAPSSGGGPPCPDAPKPPAGCLPIDRTPWSGNHGIIKRESERGLPTTCASIRAEMFGSKNPDGSWTNEGPAGDYVPGGGPAGRRGKDRRGCRGKVRHGRECGRQRSYRAGGLLDRREDSHPTWTASQLTGGMGTDPDVSFDVGERHRGAGSGTLLGVRRFTYWCVGHQVECRRNFFDEFESVCEWLGTKRTFLVEVQAGGGRSQ